MDKLKKHMNSFQMFWTITGNFGNHHPTDWSTPSIETLQTEDPLGEEQATVFDLKDGEGQQASSLPSVQDNDTILTADEVINEIDDMMNESSPEDCYNVDLETLRHNEAFVRFKDIQGRLSARNVEDMSNSALRELLSEYDATIKILLELLVSELAVRDELEFDKEVKNQFISLVVNVQKKRRDCRRKKTSKLRGAVAILTQSKRGQYLTATIPYYPCMGVPTSQQLQIHSKILQAINENSPSVPALLTDYILNVLCPP